MAIDFTPPPHTHHLLLSFNKSVLYVLVSVCGIHFRLCQTLGSNGDETPRSQLLNLFVTTNFCSESLSDQSSEI